MVVRRIRQSHWLQPGGDLQPWIDALLVLDRRGDKRPLLALLKSDTPIPALARSYMADLLERYTLKRPRGGRRTPAYDYSLAERKLVWAAASVRDDTKNGRPRKDQIEKIAAIYGVLPSTLANYLAGS